MNIFETIALLSIIVSTCIAIFLPKRKIYVSVVAAAGMLAVLISWMVHGFCFQLLPAGLISFGFFLKSLLFGHKSIPDRIRNKFIRIISKFAAVLCFVLFFLLAILLPVLFPMPVLPAPSGDYTVGVTRFYLADSTRQEIITNDSNDVREFTLTVWYPAKHTDGKKRAAYLENAGKIVASGIAGISRSGKAKKWAASFFNYLQKVKSHSYRDAEPAEIEGKFPVLIYNHGLYGFAEQNTLQMEHLASHGYVVFSINHTYFATAVVLPDKRILAARNLRPDSSSREKALTRVEELLEEPNYELYEDKLLAYFHSYPGSNDMMKYWSDDISSLIHYLEQENLNYPLDRFQHKLELKEIGVFGMSMGGGASVQYSLDHSRAKAIASLDGIYFADSLNKHIDVPFLLMERDLQYSYQLEQNHFTFNEFLVRRNAKPTYQISVENSAHFNYTDAHYLFPAFRFFSTYFLGGVSREEMNELMNTYLLAFFNQYLLEENEPVLHKEVWSGENKVRFNID